MQPTTGVFILLASLTTTAAQAHNLPMFTDIDGDGVISAPEVETARREFRASLTTRFDLNHDGVLSREERTAARRARRNAMVSEFDSDRDGALSGAERNAARQAYQAALVAQFDLDNDGQISDTEKPGLEAARAGHDGRGGQRRERRANRKR